MLHRDAHHNLITSSKGTTAGRMGLHWMYVSKWPSLLESANFVRHMRLFMMLTHRQTPVALPGDHRLYQCKALAKEHRCVKRIGDFQ